MLIASSGFMLIMVVRVTVIVGDYEVVVMVEIII